LDCNLVLNTSKSQLSEIIGKFRALKNVVVLKKDD